MAAYTHVLNLNNAHEARLLEEILKENDIPHAIISRSDSSFGSIEAMEEGFGYVSAPEAQHERIFQIYNELKSR